MTKPRVDSPAELDQFVIVRTKRPRRYVIGRVVEVSRDGAVREYARLKNGRRRNRRMNWATDTLWTAPRWQPALASFWQHSHDGWTDFQSMQTDVVRRQAQVEQEEASP